MTEQQGIHVVSKALEMWEKALAIDPNFTEAENWAKKARNKLKQK